MMGFEDINLAIERRLCDWLPPFDVALAFDNLSSDAKFGGRSAKAAQDVGEPWVRLVVQHGDSMTAGVGSSPCVRRTGLVQCQIFVAERHDKGTIVAAQIADSLAAQLEYWQEGQLSTQAASVRRGGIANGWFMYVVNVSFRAD